MDTMYSFKVNYIILTRVVCALISITSGPDSKDRFLGENYSYCNIRLVFKYFDKQNYSLKLYMSNLMRFQD